MSSSIPIADPDDYEICPYDPVHRVQSRRMVYHLEKCRKNFPMKKTRICPFNNKHRIPEPEFRYHMVLCPDKAILDQDLKHGKYSRTSLHQHYFDFSDNSKE
ncbi:gametocyte-specific factor 1-like [Octopus sinensis]|uniref:Gametocyte-specific factor 1-like n=1 Tax=Octopus sinensis TaxID=2607531 RepID=A0A6P7U696_9MOLL|nr:gametocyte-specific factor 1-like [Octopus sinensis]